MNYRYSLIIQGARIPVSPKGTDKAKYPTQRERDQIFYRRKLTGSLVFVQEDFTQLFAVEQSEDRCIEIKLEIEKKCADVWETDWKGYFSCNDVKWDLNRCSATVSPFPDDVYRPFLENYSKEFNLLQIKEVVRTETKLDFEGDFEFKSTTGNQIPDESGTWAVFLTGTYFIEGTLTKGGTRFNQDVHYRLIRYATYQDGEAPEMEGWTVVEDNVAAQRVKYAKAPAFYNFKPYSWWSRRSFDHYPDLLQIPCGEAYDTEKYIEITGPNGVNSPECGGTCWNIRKKINEDRCMRVIWEFGRFTFDRNRTFNDVVRFLVENTVNSSYLPDTDVELSAFFNNAVNYVTEKPNTLNGMLVASLSDMIGYNSSEVATKAEWSLKRLLDHLRQMFRVYWDITPEGKFRLEHEAFYQLQGANDLTRFPRHLVQTNAYEYIKQDMPRYQRLSFTNAFNADFEEGEIEYAGVCVTVEDGQDTQEETVTEVTTDLEYLIVSGGSTGQKGFVFLLVKEGEVLRQKGDLTGLEFPNAGLSAANLVADYYTYNRVLEHGLVNQKVKTFKSVNKTKKQVTLIVPVCCEVVNPYARFISTLGSNAALESMTYTLHTGSMEFVLLHDTTGKGPLEIGRQFNESFNISFN